MKGNKNSHIPSKAKNHSKSMRNQTIHITNCYVKSKRKARIAEIHSRKRLKPALITNCRSD